MATTLSAETRCPGNVESVPLFPVNGHLFVMNVFINDSGPYPFLLDTGTKFTIVDSSLAEELHLANEGAAEVTGAGFSESASLATLGHIAAGSNAVADLPVFAYNLANMRSIHLHVRGIVGEDFLAHFDMLIDNAHGMLCLDNSGAMSSRIKGRHVQLLMLAGIEDGRHLPRALIVQALLSNATRPVRLMLDSGSNAAVLYNSYQYLATGSFQGANLQGSGTDGRQRGYTSLPVQDVKIGSLEMNNVAFVTPVNGEKHPMTGEIDGLMGTSRFRWVFINHAGHFAVLDPR